MDSLEQGSSGVIPLTKIAGTGKVFTRPPEVEQQIEEVVTLNRDELKRRASIVDHDDEDYFRDETIVYLLRTAAKDGDQVFIDLMGEMLSTRIEKLCKRYSNAASPISVDFEDFVQDLRLFVLERVMDNSSNAGDFAQVRFGKFVKMAADSHKKRFLTLYLKDRDFLNHPIREENDDDTLDKIGSEELPTDKMLQMKDFFDCLTVEEKKIVKMLNFGIPIERNDPSAVTISSELGVTSRTIRNRLKSVREKWNSVM